MIGCWSWLAGAALAQPAAPHPTVGKFLTLHSPINDDVIASVRRTALELQSQSSREGRDAILVLEIPAGSSQFHHVYALADFLTSSSLQGVRTIAWVPQNVTGYNAVVALACREIVAAPEVQIGDIGSGEAVPLEQQVVVRELVARGGNPLVTRPLADAMLDPASELRLLTVDLGNGQQERRLATLDMIAGLTASGMVINDSRVVKDRGTPGRFSTEVARDGGFLVSHVAANRAAVADLYRLPAESMHESPQTVSEQKVSVIEIRGAIDTVLSTFLRRQIVRAVEAGTRTIIFELYSSSGDLSEVHQLAIDVARLTESDVRTVAWIPESATGEVALIAFACDEIYLTPEAKIGAISRRNRILEDGSAGTELEFLNQSLVEIADLKQRPLALLQAMADPKLQVFRATNRATGAVTYMTDEELQQQELEWIRGPLVSETGRGVLTLSSPRAHELKLTEGPVADFAEVLQRLGLAPGVRINRIEKTWVDQLVFTLNRRSVTAMLFTAALILIYLELHMMTGLLGLASMTCFALFFWSRFLGGTATSLEVMLFLLGLAAIAMEIFVLPGMGFFGATGAGLVLVSLVMASQTFGNIEVGKDMSETTSTLKTLSLSIIAVAGMAALLSRILPGIPLFREMVLTPPGQTLAPEQPQLAPELLQPVSEMVGATGVTETALRPSGKARINGRLLDVVSNGTFIPGGQPVEVVSVKGNHIVVREELPG